MWFGVSCSYVTAAQINNSLYDQRKLQRFKRRETNSLSHSKQSLSRWATRRLADAHKGSSFWNLPLMSSRVSLGCNLPLVSLKKSIYTSKSLTWLGLPKTLAWTRFITQPCVKPVLESTPAILRVDSANSPQKNASLSACGSRLLEFSSRLQHWGVDSRSAGVDSKSCAKTSCVPESTPSLLESTPDLAECFFLCWFNSESSRNSFRLVFPWSSTTIVHIGV